MLREGEDGLALDFAVSPARAARPKRECADQFATLIDGRGDHGPKAAAHDIRYPAGIRTVVLDHDRPPLGHRVTSDADLDRSPAYLIQQLSRIAHRRHDLEHGRILRVDQAQIHQFVAEKLAGARDDRIEHLLDVGAAGNRALQQGEPLEQGMALPKLDDQADAPQREGEDTAHPAEQIQLLLAEVAAPGPRDQKGALLADQRADPGADPEAPELAFESEIA